MILGIDATETNEAILYLFDKKLKLIKKSNYKGSNNLSEQLLINIEEFLSALNISKKSLTGIVARRGPGSYTGLRIGLTTANFMAYSLNIPIVGYEEDVENKSNLSKISAEIEAQGEKFNIPIVPLYKNPPYITKKKHC